MKYADFVVPSIIAAVSAGEKILEIYDTDFSVTEKSDHSPLTRADQESHNTIKRHLERFNLPRISEEGRDIAYEERKKWDHFWMIDPLDGTKEFIKKNGEFTVNIALIQGEAPVMGVVFIPVTQILYFGETTLGAYKLQDKQILGRLKKDTADLDLSFLVSRSQKLPAAEFAHSRYTIVGSRSHSNPELESYVDKKRQEHGDVDFISSGSSLKFCAVAEGRADIYPRLGPTMEWDTAAGQAVVECSGAHVWQYDTHAPLAYNKENLLNPWFVVER